MFLEPEIVFPEADFEREVITVCKTLLAEAEKDYVFSAKFGFDAAFFVKGQQRTYTRLLEFKSNKGARNGNVGFGNQKGGPQVEILSHSADALMLMEPLVRWVLADSLKPYRSERYAIFDCVQAKASASGGEVRQGKQNNLRLSQLQSSMVGWDVLVNRLRDFLLHED